MLSVEACMKRMEVENLYEYRKWTKEIPSLNFKQEWNVKIVPGFGGAIIRFVIYYNNRRVSVYLDCYGELGLCTEPYWEIYPYKSDAFRCSMNDTEALMGKITEVLEGDAYYEE